MYGHQGTQLARGQQTANEGELAARLASDQLGLGPVSRARNGEIWVLKQAGGLA